VSNTLSGQAVSSVIGGGSHNKAYSLFSTIGGGANNDLSSTYSSIGGGDRNSAAGSFAQTIGGGSLNALLANSSFSTIAGGGQNTVSSNSAYSTIGGGYSNLVFGGVGATVPGGQWNSAKADGSFAAGTRAIAAHEGSFALADRQPGYFSTDVTNQFAIRAQNGVMINGTANVLDLRGDGAIRVAGAGVGSQGPVFIHRATPSSISGHITTIDHPLANGDPNAILMVTHNYSADTSATRYEPYAVGVWYDGSRWTIFHENTSIAMPVGRAFNVIIIKP
jgi:hypothetical protein